MLYQLAQPRMWGKKMAFSPVSLYCETFGGPSYNLETKKGIFQQSACTKDSWWPNLKSRDKKTGFSTGNLYGDILRPNLESMGER